MNCDGGRAINAQWANAARPPNSACDQSIRTTVTQVWSKTQSASATAIYASLEEELNVADPPTGSA